MATKHLGPLTFGRCADHRAGRAVCPRCAELDGGAAPVQWRGRQDGYGYGRPDIARHDCRASRCAHVCTFGDW